MKKSAIYRLIFIPACFTFLAMVGCMCAGLIATRLIKGGISTHVWIGASLVPPITAIGVMLMMVPAYLREVNLRGRSKHAAPEPKVSGH